MGGAGGNNVELAIDAFCAGHDMLLWDLEYVDVLEEKIKSGEIPMERLDDAVRRIFEAEKSLSVREKKKRRIIMSRMQKLRKSPKNPPLC